MKFQYSLILFQIEKKSIVKRSSIIRRVKEFRSNDYGSYSVLMDRNGYKFSKFFKYRIEIDKTTGERKLVKKLTKYKKN